MQAASSLRTFYVLKPLRFDPPRWDWVTFLEGELQKLDLRREQITLKAKEMVPQN